MNPVKKYIASNLVLTILACTTMTVSASTAYPVKPIKIVVPFATGGTTDVMARVLSEPLAKELGQPVIVENRTGAAGKIGTEYLARAKNDGYTLGIATVSSTAITPVVYKNVSFDPLKDLTAITRLVSVPNVLVVSPNLQVNNMADFLDVVKKDQGKYFYGHAGNGSEAHMMGELFNLVNKTKLNAVPYQGSAPALQDALGGQVSAVFDNLPSSLPFIKSKQLLALAVAYPERVPTLPDTPTFKELGMEVVNDSSFFGLIGPANMPKEITLKIQETVKKVLAQPAVLEKLKGFSAEPVGNTPEAFAQEIKLEVDKQRKTAKAAKIQFD
ncbi:tripartite tricarboxylate transporter substrate binding protein [Advenella sp. FME57]|nr:tripartite tricarboxylate transporter substrate binding protein [Advenella sp. FME57]